MDNPRTDEQNKAGEHPRPNDASNGEENDPEAIANRVVDVFWESFHASKEEDS